MIRKNISRTISHELLDNEIIKNIIDYLKMKEYFFETFRTSPERITVYYKGRVICELTYGSRTKECFILPRSISESHQESIVKINQAYQQELIEYYPNGIFKKIVLKDMQTFIKILTAGKHFLDAYYHNKIEEKIIQQEIACHYQLNENFICVDQEYNQCFSDSKEKNKYQNIQGRYDLIMLKKMPSHLYKIIFVELKSDMAACTDYFTGLINHRYDAIGFINAYHDVNNATFRNSINEGIKFAVKEKLNLDIELDEQPEFSILFDFISEEKKKMPKTRQEVYRIIDEEVNRAIRTKSLDNIKKLNQDKVVYGIYSKRDIDDNIKNQIYQKFKEIKLYYDDFIEIKDE